jgi:hypothetical protein
MHRSRVDTLADALRAQAWTLMEGELELNADDIGNVAAALEKTFRGLFVETCDGCGDEGPTMAGLCVDCYRRCLEREEDGDPIPGHRLAGPAAAAYDGPGLRRSMGGCGS